MHLGVCYYPEHVSPERWEEDASRMKELGLTYVRLAEFSWSRIEPERDNFQFEWLDKAVEILAGQDLKIVMCTPTATPPKWLIEEHPSILAKDKNGNIRNFGSRRHYSFSSKIYRSESRRITEIFAERYGNHPAIAVWQTDNEYGCHDTVVCYSEESLTAFRDWLTKKYGSIEKLNEAWGNVFWSMEYNDFSQIELPNFTVTEPNPSHCLDFRRFSSDQVVSFNREQVEIIKKHSPDRRITHNAMGYFFDYDHHKLSGDLDFISWDSYPLGFLSVCPSFSEEEKNKYLRQGHPDFSSFTHDLYEGCSTNNGFWVMEQQPGPVNWAPYNPAPSKNIVRLWTWEAFAHGAETVSYFRWRNCPFAQEQEHAGLNFSDHMFTPYADEVSEVADEIKLIKSHIKEKKNPAVGLIFDYESLWEINIQPQGCDFDVFRLYLNFYRAVRELGLNVEIVSGDFDCDKYSLLLAPCFSLLKDELFQKLRPYRQTLLCGPRSLSKTPDFKTPTGLEKKKFEELFGNQILFSESLPKSHIEKVKNSASNQEYDFSIWKESFRKEIPNSEIQYQDGSTALISKENKFYLGFYPETRFLKDYISKILPDDLRPLVENLPPGVRKTAWNNLIFYFNFSSDDYLIPETEGYKLLLGSQNLAGNQISVLGSVA